MWYHAALFHFSEALSMLQRFVPRKVNIRGQKFYLELASDMKLPLNLFKKIQPADFKLSMAKYAMRSDTQLKRETVYEKVKKNDEPSDEDAAAADDTGASTSRRGPKILGKDEVIKGYKFGSTIVPFNEEDRKEYGWVKESRCFKLLQFTKRSQGYLNLLTFFALQDACIAMSALVNAMIAEDTVALVRYVYNAASHPRIMALFPRRSKKGVEMFVGLTLPFYEDFRGVDFPPLDDPATEPKNHHLSAMHALAKAMDLSKAYL
ncbi:unnamed protein product [Gongylonema pulchrum]|uniref:Ku domain-containing protein n=1 Tax=Gongylonema pulchrum TaxID=637853 RepID=A0A3P7M9C3_9BILA|nr:unnamed protein product [Gongylonema pulchrum]